jgi:hypothetical protein
MAVHMLLIKILFLELYTKIDLLNIGIRDAFICVSLRSYHFLEPACQCCQEHAFDASCHRLNKGKEVFRSMHGIITKG